MKEVMNVQTALPGLHPGDVPQTYADLLRQCLDFAPQGTDQRGAAISLGFTPDLIRKRARVEKAIADVKSGDVMKFEDADYVTAQEAVKSVTWVRRLPEYLAFSEAFGV